MCTTFREIPKSNESLDELQTTNPLFMRLQKTLPQQRQESNDGLHTPALNNMQTFTCAWMLSPLAPQKGHQRHRIPSAKPRTASRTQKKREKQRTVLFLFSLRSPLNETDTTRFKPWANEVHPHPPALLLHPIKHRESSVSFPF